MKRLSTTFVILLLGLVATACNKTAEVAPEVPVQLSFSTVYKFSGQGALDILEGRKEVGDMRTASTKETVAIDQFVKSKKLVIKKGNEEHSYYYASVEKLANGHILYALKSTSDKFSLALQIDQKQERAAFKSFNVDSNTGFSELYMK